MLGSFANWAWQVKQKGPAGQLMSNAVMCNEVMAEPDGSAIVHARGYAA
jgi:hypothetical protein